MRWPKFKWIFRKALAPSGAPEDRILAAAQATPVNNTHGGRSTDYSITMHRRRLLKDISRIVFIVNLIPSSLCLHKHQIHYFYKER